MDKRKLIYILPVLFLAVLWIFWPDSEEDKKIKLLKNQAKRAALAANPQSGEYREFIEQNKKLFTEEGMYSFSQLMEMARTGRLSLVAELWRLRTKCDTAAPDKDGKQTQQMNFDECNIRIENFLREQYPKPDNEKMITLFRNYMRYEDAMRRLQVSEKMPLAERLEFMKKKRREFFSDADAQLIFGYEEARSATQDALSEFYKTSAALPAEERVKKYYEIRQKNLGDYNTAFNEQEPAYTRYETEVLLRGDEMARKGNAAAETQTMREKFFGAEAAKRMAQVDKEIQQERARIDSYETAAQKFAAENASLSEADKKKKLADLRVNMLGKEEAEAYERRMQYEEYLRQNHLK
jgi:Proteobacterial lipase chaperone protein